MDIKLLPLDHPGAIPAKEATYFPTPYVPVSGFTFWAVPVLPPIRYPSI